MAADRNRNQALQSFALLENVCLQFNSENVDKVLKQCSEKIVGYLDLKPDVLRNISRKWGIPQGLILPCTEFLCNKVTKSTDSEVLRKISETVKHSVQKVVKSQNVDKDPIFIERMCISILTAYSKINDLKTQSQLKGAFEHLSRIQYIDTMLEDIYNKIEPNANINEFAKEMLLEKIRRKKCEKSPLDYFNDPSLAKIKFGKVESSYNSDFHRATAFVTQSQSTTTDRSSIYESERAEISSFNLAKKLADRAKVLAQSQQQNVNAKAEISPDEEKTKSGSYLFPFHDTIQEVAKLLQIARSKDLKLTEEDVNEYLADKLLGYHFWTWTWFTEQKGSQVNVDITEIILVYSKDHKLCDIIIEKLFRCLSDTPTKEKFTAGELSQLWINSVHALNNCRHRQDIFSSDKRLKIIRDCLKLETDSLTKSNIRKAAIPILKDFSTLINSVENDQAVFEGAFEELENEESVDIIQFVDTIMEKTWDQDKCRTFFTEVWKERLIALVVETNYSLEKRSAMADVSVSFLTFCSVPDIFSISLIEKLVSALCDDMELASRILQAVVLALERSDDLEVGSRPLQLIAAKLVFSLGTLGDANSNLAVVAVSRMVKRQSVTVPIVENLLAQLLNESIVYEYDGIVNFINPQKGEEEYPAGVSISNIVADMILISTKLALAKNDLIAIKILSLNILLGCLEKNNDKQTRICISEVFYLCKDILKKPENEALITEVLERIYGLAKDSIPDVRAHCSALYCYYIIKWKVNITEEHIRHAAEAFSYQYYFTDDIDVDLNSKVNDRILKLLLKAATHGHKFPEEAFNIFDHILSLDSTVDWEIVLDILLKVVTHKHLLPACTITSLESVFDSFQSVLVIFKLCIKNKQEVPEKIIDLLVDDLYNCQDDVQREESFLLLDLAHVNQELSDDAFEALEMERAGRIGDSEELVVIKNRLQYLMQKVQNMKTLTIQNFNTFISLIGRNTEINIFITKILICVSENEYGIPDSVVTRFVRQITITIGNELLSHYCQLFITLIKNGQTITHSNELQTELETLLLCDIVESPLFHEIFQILSHIVQPDRDLSKSFFTSTIVSLLNHIRNDVRCRQSFIEFLPNIIMKLSDERLKSKAKEICLEYFRSSDKDIALNCIKGLRALSYKCSTTLSKDEIQDLLKFARESENTSINLEICNILESCVLTEEECLEKNNIALTASEKNDKYYLEKMKRFVEDGNYVAAQKFLFCITNILESKCEEPMREAVQVLRSFLIDDNSISSVNIDLFEVLVNTFNNKSLWLDINDILTKIVEKAAIGNSVVTEKNATKLFDIYKSENTIYSIKNGSKVLLEKIISRFNFSDLRYKLLLETFESKNTQTIKELQEIQSQIKNGNTNNILNGDRTATVQNQLWSKLIKCAHLILDRLLENNFSNSAANLNVFPEEFSHKISIYTEIICSLLASGEIKLRALELEHSETYNQLVSYMENIISLRKFEPFSSCYVQGCKLLFENVRQEPERNLDGYFQLIPIFGEHMRNAKAELSISVFEYILEAIKVKEYVELHFNNHGIMTLLKKGLLNKDNNVIRMLSFDGLLHLNEIGFPSEDFDSWCKEKLETMNKFTKSDSGQTLHADNVKLLRTVAFSSNVNFSILQDIPVSRFSIEILRDEILCRYCANRDPFKTFEFAEDLVKVANNERFTESPEKLHMLLENLLVAVDKGKLAVQNLHEIILCFEYLNPDMVLKVVDSPEGNSFEMLLEKALFRLIHSKVAGKTALPNITLTENMLAAAKKFFKNISLKHYYQVFGNIECIDSVEDMHCIFTLISEIGMLKIDKCKNSRSYLRKLQVQSLVRYLCPLEIKVKCVTLLKNLLERNFCYDSLKIMLHSAADESQNDIHNFSNEMMSLVKLFDQYEISSKIFTEISNSLPRNKKEWLAVANKKVVDHIFYADSSESLTNRNATIRTNKKPLAKIINQFKKFNSKTLRKSNLLNFSFQSTIENIRNCNELSEEFAFGISNRIISSWGDNEFKNWAQKVKENNDLFQNESFLQQTLSVILRANSKAYNFDITDGQILSCLLALKCRIITNRGLLQQVVTGGGKSTIIRILAILQALQGKNVFVVTSNSVLAQRDANTSRKIFGLFGITVAHNGDKPNYLRGGKECYKKDVIFGDAQFQFDILRHEYSCLETLGELDLENTVAIVDEVDNMFIDDNSKFTRLASTIPGMDQLQFIYHFLWDQLCNIQCRIFTVNERNFLGLGKVNISDDGIFSLEFVDSSENIRDIKDLKEYILAGGNIQGICKEIVGDVEKWISNHLENLLKAMLTDDVIEEEGYEVKQENKLQVPNHLNQFVKNQIPIWVENSLTALSYVENVHYIVHDGIIKPVDFDTTGAIQGSTSWSGGLHQFLQLKHNLELTSETLATNYLSTIAFFRRFKGNRLFGFTGTFGSDAAKEYISTVYNVNLLAIPPSYVRRCHIFKDVIVNSSQEWLKQILESAKFEVIKNRAVLIICRTIREAEIIFRELSKLLRPNSVRLYSKNLGDESKHVERISPGEVIVATNLAGRGTDIKTDRMIEDNGGLHVCMTFLPLSKRAELQGTGRTARLYNIGTAQFILLNYGNASQEDLKKIRDDNEKLYLEQFVAMFLKGIVTKGELFQSFCSLLKKIRDRLYENKSKFQKVKSVCLKKTLSVYEKNILGAIEEQWALFIRETESLQGDAEVVAQSMQDQYNEFKNLIEQKMIDGKPEDYVNVIKSPFYAICIGNDFIENGNYSEAMKHFKYAINKDNNFSAGAYYGIAWCLVAGEKNSLGFVTRSASYKNATIEKIGKALDFLKNEIAKLSQAHSFLSHRVPESDKTDLGKQIIEKANILGQFMSGIENSIKVIKSSKRLVDVKYKKIGPLWESEEYFEMERGTPLNQNFNSCDYTVDLNFHELTVKKDTVDSDQAINFIDSLSTQKFQVELIESEAVNFRSLLNPHVEYQDISKSKAQLLLEGEQTKMALIRSKITKLVNKEIPCQVDLVVNKSDGSSYFLENVSKVAAATKVDSCEDSSKFHLKFLNQNKYNQKFLSSDFDVLLLQVDPLKAKNIFESMEGLAGLLKIKLVGKAEQLTQLLSNEIVSQRKIDWYLPKKNNVQTVRQKSAESFNVQEYDPDTVICFEFTVSGEEALSIFENEDSFLSFYSDITCQSVNLSKVLELLNFHGGKVSLSVKVQDEKVATSMITAIREAKLDFSIKVLDLTFWDAEELIKSTCISEEDIVVVNSRHISSIFLDGHRPKEILEFSSRGLEYLLVFNEREFVPWISVGIIGLLGSAQILVGVGLICTGLGAPLGMSLLTEGSVDLMVGYKAYSNRNFSWSDYAVQKTVSLSISAITLGAGAFKNAGQGVVLALEGIGAEVAEQATTQMILHGKDIASVAIKAGKSLSSLAWKQAGIAVAEAASRQCLYEVADLGSNFMFSNLEATIQSFVVEKVKLYSETSSLLQLIHRLHVFESHIKVITDGRLSEKVNKFLNDFVSPSNSFWNKHWTSFALILAQGVANSTQNVGNPILIVSRLVTMGLGINEVATVIERICRDLKQSLEKYEKDFYTLTHVVQFVCKFETPNEAKDFATVLNRPGNVETSFYEYMTGNPRSIDDIPISEFIRSDGSDTTDTVRFHIQTFEKFLRKVNASIHEDNTGNRFDIHSQTLQLIVDVITKQMIQVTQAKLVTPVTTFAIGYLVKNVSIRLQQKIASDADNSHTHTEERKRYDELKKRLDNKGEISKDEQKFYNHFADNKDKVTIAKQIYDNANDYNTAKYFMTLISPSLPVEQGDTKTKEILKIYAQDIRSNNRKAGMVEIVHLSKDSKYPLTITKDESEVPELKERFKGSYVLVCNGTDSSGPKLRLFDSQSKEIVSVKNDGYKILEHITGKKESDLRNKMAKACETDKAIVGKFQADALLNRHGIYDYNANRAGITSKAMNSVWESIPKMAVAYGSKLVSSTEPEPSPANGISANVFQSQKKSAEKEEPVNNTLNNFILVILVFMFMVFVAKTIGSFLLICIFLASVWFCFLR